MLVADVILSACPVCGQVYYVDANSTGYGDGTTPEITGEHAAWKEISEISGLQPGNTVLFRRGNSWRQSLKIEVSGEPGNPITFDAYGEGKKPLIDLSQLQEPELADWRDGCCICVGRSNSNVDYIRLSNFRLKGSGYHAALGIWDGTNTLTGNDANGFTIEVNDVDVLQSYNANNGDISSDGFSMAGKAQAVFYNITATKCRVGDWLPGRTYLAGERVYYENIGYVCVETHISTNYFEPDKWTSAGYAESNQCLTLHTSCKAKVYRARFSDCCNAIVNTAGTYCEVYEMCVRGAHKGAVLPSTPTDEFYLLVADSNILVDTVGYPFGYADTAAEDRFIIRDSVVTITGGSQQIIRGNVTLEDCILNLDNDSHRFLLYGGVVKLKNCTINAFRSKDPPFWVGVYNGRAGAIQIKQCLVDFASPCASRFLFFSTNGVEPDHRSLVANCVIKNCGNWNSLIEVEDDSCGVSFVNNTVYNTRDAGGAALIDVQHDGDEQEGFGCATKNNIFCNVPNVLLGDSSGWGTNCFWRSYPVVGVGCIETDPCFADPNNGDFHLRSQAGRWNPIEKSWVFDDVTSRCIDAGDIKNPVMYEQFPNGGVVNLGAYGGTCEASRSYFDAPLCETIIAGDINGDCKINALDFALMATHWLK